MALEIIHVDTPDMLDEFYKDWSLTFIGVILEEAHLYLEYLQKFNPIKNRVYTFKGKLMNDHYHLSGDNRYPDDLTFLVIKIEDIKDPGHVVLHRYEISGHFFTDIVDNNAKREADKLL